MDDREDLLAFARGCGFAVLLVALFYVALYTALTLASR